MRKLKEASGYELTPEQKAALRRADEIRVQMLRVEAEARRVAARVVQKGSKA